MSSKRGTAWLPFRSRDREHDCYEPIRWKQIAMVKFTVGGTADVFELKAEKVVFRGSVDEREASDALRSALEQEPEKWLRATIDVGPRSPQLETIFANVKAIAHVTIDHANERSFQVELRGGEKFGGVSPADAFAQLKLWLNKSIEPAEKAPAAARRP